MTSAAAVMVHRIGKMVNSFIAKRFEIDFFVVNEGNLKETGSDER